MIRRFLVVILISVIPISSPIFSGLTHSSSQEPCTQNHRAWVAQALQKIETIQVGMTREDLLKIFATEGGLSNGLERRFISRECPYFKVDVEFNAVGRPNRDSEGRVTLLEDNRDIIVKISRPYLQFSIAD